MLAICYMYLPNLSVCALGAGGGDIRRYRGGGSKYFVGQGLFSLYLVQVDYLSSLRSKYQ